MPIAGITRILLWGIAGSLSFVTLLLSPTQHQNATPPVKKTSAAVVVQPIATTTQTVATTTAATATSTPKTTKIAPSKTKAAAVASTPTPITPPAPVVPVESFTDINTAARGAIVNIICTTVQGGLLNPISASGVIIDPRGIVLTNAHVGQYLLLKDYPFIGNISCILRMGSPAQPKYTVELMYLPPAWITANAKQINATDPTGTGENDYAFLHITGVINPQTMTLPTSFPFLPISYDDPKLGENILVAGYPAGFLGGITIAMSLYSTSTIVPIATLYTFDVGTIDLVSLGASIAAQKGVSGGAAVKQYGQLIGVEATAREATNTADRDLRAITIGHIDRSLTKERGVGLSSLLAADPSLFAQTYQLTIAPTLTRQLIDAIGH